MVDGILPLLYDMVLQPCTEGGGGGEGGEGEREGRRRGQGWMVEGRGGEGRKEGMEEGRRRGTRMGRENNTRK